MAKYRNAQEALDHAYYLNWCGNTRRARELLALVIRHVVKEVPSGQTQVNSYPKEKGDPNG